MSCFYIRARLLCLKFSRINNSLADHDDIARQKRCLYAQADVLARIYFLCSTSSKLVYFKHTLVQCTLLPSICCASFMFATKYIKSFSERIRSYIFSLLCRLRQSENPLFVNYVHTHIRFSSSMYTY